MEPPNKPPYGTSNVLPLWPLPTFYRKNPLLNPRPNTLAGTPYEFLPTP
jgi:hypothetical protein